VNGEPGDLILHQRGLRQGDPLSPMLFILVMDVLNSLVLKASEQNLLQPLMGGARRQRGQRISLYADDVVLFLQPQPAELSLVKVILRYSVKLLGWLQISASAPLLLLLAEARRFNLCSSSSRAAWFSFPANTWVCLSLSPKATQGCLLFTH
jgi:hypothetical protein